MINREQIVLANGQFRKQMNAGLRTTCPVQPHYICPGSLKDFHGIGESFPGSQTPFLAHAQRRHHGNIGQVLENIQRE